MSSPDYAGRNFPGSENLRHDLYPSISAADKPSLQQSGKIVVVTGASRGIGRAVVLQYAHAGVAALVLVARSIEALESVEREVGEIRDGSVKVVKVAGDMTNEADVEKIREALEKETEGRIDVLVNNAGVVEAWKSIPSSKPEDWWRTFEVNLKAPYLVLHALLPLLTKTAKTLGPDGKVDVINMTSIGAHSVIAGASAYQTSKLAVLRLTQFVDLENSAEGVVATGVHPGGVVTDMTREMENLRPVLIDTPELAGGFCVWLTAENRKWLSGRYLSATWDVERLESMREEIVEGDKLKIRLVI